MNVLWFSLIFQQFSSDVHWIFIHLSFNYSFTLPIHHSNFQFECSFKCQKLNLTKISMKFNYFSLVFHEISLIFIEFGFIFIDLNWFCMHSWNANDLLISYCMHPTRSLITEQVDLSSLAQGERCLGETQRRSERVSEKHRETTCSLTTQTLNLRDVAHN